MEATFTGQLLALVAVGALWGVTNPLLKRSAETPPEDREKNQGTNQSSLVQRYLAKFIHLVTHWKSVVPFALNQCGSLLFFITLSRADLSLAVPLANSLAFCFTIATGWFIGETVHNRSFGGLAGLALMLTGIILCTAAKAQ